MGKEKDLAEKILEDHTDVFADIVNAIIFKGKQVVKPDELENTRLEAAYRSLGTGKVRGQERDVAKIWTKCGVKIALCGLENQSSPDKYMPFRVFGYEGLSYRDMLKGDPVVYPVITLVLYFGDRRWNYPKSIKELLKDTGYLPELEAFINDVNINVCEVAFLSKEEIERFRSDFKVVARFFSRKRTDPEYALEDKTEITHVEDVLNLLSAVTGDSRYEEIMFEDNAREEVHNMCDIAQKIEDRGRMQGLKEGKASERSEMIENLASTLMDEQKTLTKADAEKQARKMLKI